MKYQIVSNHYVDGLESEVAELITKGWRPLGGVAVANDQGYIEFFQAMTKEEA